MSNFDRYNFYRIENIFPPPRMHEVSPRSHLLNDKFLWIIFSFYLNCPLLLDGEVLNI